MSKIISSFFLVFTALHCIGQPPQTSDKVNQIDPNGKLQGEWIFLNNSGEPYLIASYIDSRPVDTLTFYKNSREFVKLFEIDKGKVLFFLVETKTEVIRTRENGKYIFRLQDGTLFEETSQFNSFMETAAVFPGGEAAFLKFQSENLQYPASAAKKNIQGPVTASFLVRQNGTVDDIKIIKGLNRKCDKEVLRVLNLMPDWQPGLQRGYPITARVSIVINFKL